MQEIGMVNPPRKAKRLRELALKDGASATPEFQLSSIPDSTARQSSPQPAPAPKRRGRKPAGSLSKSAREQLRKTNHSVIEKRRREKINEALAALRQLVPNEKAQEDGEKKDKEEREFKLEILVRTVDYLRKMISRVEALEKGACESCRGSLQPLGAVQDERPVKRKRMEYNDEESEDGCGSDDDHEMDDEPVPESHSNTTSPSNPFIVEGSRRPSLPPISSWITNSSASPQVFQLLSPPQSVPFAPIQVANSALPGLVLPPALKPPKAAPAAPASSQIQPSSSRSAARCRPIHDVVPSQSLPYPSPSARSTPNPLTISNLCHNDHAPSRHPTPSTQTQPQRRTRSPSTPHWSRDDQTAVSLLLNFSSKSSSGSSADERSPSQENYAKEDISPWMREQEQERMDALPAHTPRSMLGMHAASSSRSGPGYVHGGQRDQRL